ncbi:hypothetical protein SAMN05444141_103756 [Pseudovibrio denitrificans]|uniref:Uncharacterized protein n=1 Tax=Pseudovibrio denitrificans TaxID=258256 RepID=A0A1I7B8G1_9HYPH|nr:hypothetical protein [Pseudovibrio denitrificans]SFT83428.1 hypothetical protein SAMN05444141_103756 [Pseudovibrio denitrificans]
MTETEFVLDDQTSILASVEPKVTSHPHRGIQLTFAENDTAEAFLSFLEARYLVLYKLASDEAGNPQLTFGKAASAENVTLLYRVFAAESGLESGAC